ncbi:MAG: VWA domain-containing protein [Gammaproteobacteria bacterium]|nr:VWA domain-containing protein [Gammaproteobacteria bacterium]
MIHFEWPWLLLVLPLPWLLRRFLPPVSVSQAALKVPFLADFDAASGRRAVVAERRWPLWLALLAWLLLVLAAARPQWMGEPILLPQSGRDLLLAVDLSGSMQEDDFEIGGRRVDRLTATKRVAGEFIQRREGDRIGLILFGAQAYVQVPLTFDRETVLTLLYESAIGLAGKETAIGDAIGLAVKRLQAVQSERRVLILLTDGANTAGEVAPLKAAQLAAEKGLKIYTIGVGATEKEVRSLFGTRRVNPSRDLDEKTLRAIAEQTQGRYFRARNTQELQQIYRLLDELEPSEGEAIRYRPRSALYPWLLLAVLLLALPLLLREGKS